MKMSESRSKDELKAAAEALFADLDASFGKKAKRAPSTPALKPKPISEGIQANRIAELMSANSPWRAVAVVAHLVEQSCRCCGGKTEYIGNILIRHSHKTRGYIWDHTLPTDASHAFLPKIIETLPIVVEECPSCLRTNLFQQDIDTPAPQLKLFH